jgi:hypothetical protein
MSPRKERIDCYLEAVDQLLVPQGFERRKRSQEWTRPTGNDATWVHLNFGKIVINPSVGVSYLDIEERWNDVPGAVCGVFNMLDSLFDPSRSRTLDDAPHGLVADLVERGLPRAIQLQDRQYVVELMLSNVVENWPTASFSDRIRITPLLLIALNRTSEARAIMDEFAAASLGRDQILPKYDFFRAEVLARLNA